MIKINNLRKKKNTWIEMMGVHFSTDLELVENPHNALTWLLLEEEWLNPEI